MSTVTAVGYSGLLRRLNMSAIGVIRELRYIQEHGGKFDRQGEAADISKFLNEQGGRPTDHDGDEFSRFDARAARSSPVLERLNSLANENTEEVELLQKLADDPSSSKEVDPRQLKNLEQFLRAFTKQVDRSMTEGYNEHREDR